MNKKMCLIGAGRVGSSLFKAFADNGYTPAAIISRTEASAKSLSEHIGSSIYGTDYSLIPNDVGFILISVSDDNLVEAVESLDSTWNFGEGTLVTHTSGIIESSILEPLKNKGAKIVSIHPAASFSTDGEIDIKGITFGVEGADIESGIDLVTRIGGKPIKINPGKKSQYHAACTFASGYINTLLGVSDELLRKSGVENPTEIISNLVETAMQGWKTDGSGALTGSIARGDSEAVKKHLEALADDKTTLQLYKTLALSTLQSCEKNNLLDTSQVEALKAIIHESNPSN